MADNKGGTGVLDQKSGTGKGQQGKPQTPTKETVADLNIRIDTVIDMQASGPKSAAVGTAVWTAFNENDNSKIDEVTEAFKQSLLNTVSAARTLAGTDPSVNRKFNGKPCNGTAIVEALLGVGGVVAREVKADRLARRRGNAKSE